MASALGTATTLIGHVKDDEGRIQTEPFLNIARLLLPIIGESLLGCSYLNYHHFPVAIPWVVIVGSGGHKNALLLW